MQVCRYVGRKVCMYPCMYTQYRNNKLQLMPVNDYSKSAPSGNLTVCYGSWRLPICSMIYLKKCDFPNQTG